ncbi:uncharacterized protein LOC112196311 [Rosa chinensis]|uniref:uncharacterized protein LOC112196311 n=1 Tax=Rosa chinensis TaxID=74649 RepID=UPI000D08EF0C|nr:uncharacterized protein LOC112196311 [Rosa chinensis]
MEKICFSVLGKLAEYTVAPVLRQFSYLIHCESNIDNLTSQAGRLADKRDGIQLAMDAATRNLETIAPEVESWLHDVNNTIQDKETCFEEETVAKATCCNGWFPNLKYRHSLSRKAKKMTVIVDKLLGDGSFAVISHPAPPPEIFPFPNKKHSESVDKALAKPHEWASSSGTSNPAPPSLMKLSENLEYRLPYTKVVNALHNDDINMIGICGTIKGGDTMTAKEFIQIVKHQDIFEEVVMAVVSHDPDLKRIQVEIGDMLGLNLENMSLIEGAEMLHSRMFSDTERFLVVLADVWKILDLEAVGIPHGESNQGCKIIFLSRLPNVFSELRTQSNFKLLLTSISVEGPMDFESRSSVLTEVMNALTDDQINPIVICGMPGIGKTTLVKEVGKKAKEGGLFDEVAMAVMTQDPDLSHIQDEIADFLGLKLTEQSLPGRAYKLRGRLSGSKRVLVILDNVSTPVDLEALGIPLCCDKQGCKILVSSRSQDRFNEIKTKKNFPIGVLKESEAWCLFKESAGDSIESPELHSVAHQVLSECAGLPIAISTVGRALQHKSKQMWKDAVRQLRKACPENIPGVIQEVYGKIKLSYECLSSKEAKSCFLLCCLYPESGNILVEDLVKYGVGLGLFNSIDSMEEGRNSVETLIDILKSCFLLLDSNKKGCVRMHDVVRDVALFIFSEGKERFLVRCEVELKDWPKINSVSKQYMCSTLINNQTHQHTVLLLLSSMDKLSLEPPSTIFEGMGDLKVLGMRSTVVSPILPSLPLLRNLQTLSLEHCNFNNDHVKILNSVLGKLRTLMILSFRGSCIKELPDELKNLSKLRLLDLTGCIGLEMISPRVISSLTQLEELYMWNSFDNWVVLRDEHVSETLLRDEHASKNTQLFRPEELVNIFESARFEEHRKVNTNAELSELLSLSCLTSLEAALPPTKTMQSSVAFHKLERFKISIESRKSIYNFFMDEERRLDVSPSENYLRLHDLDGNSLVGSTISMLLKKTNTLDLKMKKLKDALNFIDGDCFVNLKSLTLQDCKAMEYLIDMTDIVPLPRNAVLPVLDTLNIRSADRMKEICHGQLPMGSFEKLIQISLSNLSQLTHVWKIEAQFECLENLRRVVVKSCSALKFVFLLSTGNDLKQLEELEIASCPSLEEIFTLEGSGHQIKCLNLIRLSLVDLRLKASTNACMMNFPQLITLELRRLPELISLFPSHLASKHSSNATNVLFDPKVKPFRELRYMVVSSCNNLLGVFSSSVVQNLQNLEQLEVWSCDSLETVFELEGLEIKEKDGVTATLLSCLEKMELGDLPMLAYLWKPPQNILAFQNLTTLQVSSCNRLEYVFPLFMVGGLVKLESMYITYCPRIAEIFAKTEEHGNEEKTNEIVISQVKTLHLSGLHRLKRFCLVPCTVDFPSLKTLVLTDCGDLKTFVPPVVATGSDPIYLFGEQVDFPVLETLEIRDVDNFKEIFSKQISHNSFCELRDLNVSNCMKLLHSVPMFMQNRLPKLEKLHVSDCRSLEGIFELREISADEGEAVTIAQSGETSSISQPERIINQMDSRLTRGFPNLTSINISHCNNLRNLLSLSTARGLVKLKNLSIDHCQKMEEIIAADGKETEDTVVFPILETLEIRDMDNFKEIFSKQISHNSFCELRDLNVSNCMKLLHSVPMFMQNRLPKLEKLHVSDCRSLEGIFELREISADEGEAVTISQSGETPSISQPERTINQMDYRLTKGFPNLTSIKISGCNNLRYLLSLSIAIGLVKLKNLSIDHCQKMEEIIAADGKETEDTVVFPILETLEIHFMDNFKEIFSKQISHNSFCELRVRVLRVSFCNKLERLFPIYMQNGLQKLESLIVEHCSLLEEIFECSRSTGNEHAVVVSQSVGIQSHQGFQSLTSIEILKCERLRILLSPRIARGLTNLKTINICRCEGLEEIVTKEVEETDMRNILPQLTFLKLDLLINLTSFSQGKYILEWPLMEEILITWCPKMKKFCFGSLSTPREVKLSFNERTDVNLQRELENSRK